MTVSHSTQEILNFCGEHLKYQDGILFWIKRSGRGSHIHPGQRAGGFHKDGYLQTKIFGKMHLNHRLIWLIHHGRWPAEQLDHINGDRQDNRIENLREVTNSQNSQNQKNRKTNTSGFPGVCWNKTSKKWSSYAYKDKKRIHLGYFNCPITSFRAYCVWCRANRSHTPYTWQREQELIDNYLKEKA
jgi:hypothetical protein